MSKQDFFKLGEIYSNQLNNIKHKIVTEQKHQSKVKPGEIGEAPLIKGGPDSTDGYVKDLIDKKNKKIKDDNLYDIDNLSQDETSEETDKETKSKKLTTESQKIARRSINKFMRKKSLFDRLYENVMTPGAPAPDMGGDMNADVGMEEPLPGGGEEEMDVDIEAPEEEPLGGIGRSKR